MVSDERTSCHEGGDIIVVRVKYITEIILEVCLREAASKVMLLARPI